MYLSELKLWNFRKYGIKGDKFETSEPGLTVEFNEGLNVLVGENDSGKTAIIDAIKHVLKTQSMDYFKIEEKDFYKSNSRRTTEMKIECTFKGFKEDGSDSAHFLEWLGFDENNEYILRIWLYAKKVDNRIIQTVRAGMDSEGMKIDGEARELLKVVYLKPLRDALTEMTHGNRSRLAQILSGHNIFKKEIIDGEERPHPLEEKYGSLKSDIDTYFKQKEEHDNSSYEPTTNGGGEITEKINSILKNEFFFMNEDRNSSITLTGNELNDILKQLDLILEDNKSGLGSLNMLFMASELLLLEENRIGLNLTLIEELEAHLHPQYQLRVIDFIQRRNKFGQFILTTHSTTLASKINLKNLLICTKDGNVFPMGSEYTQLEEGDYEFLERFLDATKANLFFAKGVIFVEGDAENLLLPTIAELIDKPLHKYGVSIVNIGNTAFLRYSRIFTRKKEPFMNIPVAVVTDLDFKPLEYHEEQRKNHEDGGKEYEFPDIYMITDENISELQELTEVIDFNELKNTAYEHKKDFKEVLKSFKKRPNFEPGGIEDKIIAICKKELNRDNFTQVKDKTHEMKSKYYQNEDQKVESFVSPNWTLEYELALSHINNELFQAIKRAEVLKRGNRITLTDSQKAAIIKNVNKFFSDNDSVNASEKAYEIYNYLLKKKISKAVTAQCLADILLEKKNIGETDDERSENWKNFKEWFQTEVKKDNSPLKYLVDAIEHVTSVSENDIEVN